ncbi:MAG: thiamine ABC transporter substrate-binding protein [Acidimicrobiia bacterium]|nr:MAG: thiamine ABC transporter substrate-binding protein [Acidimicrobiia bacterium]
MRAIRATILVVVLAACTPATTPTTTTAAPTTSTAQGASTTEAVTSTTQLPPERLTIVSHDSFAAGVTPDTFAGFTAETGIEVEVLPAGDTGLLVNQAILTRDDPVADVLFGVDDTFLSRALEAGIFLPYRSPLLDRVPDRLKLDPENRVTPIDYGDVCLNYDKAAFQTVPPPDGLGDLVEPEYRGLTVVENPATSSPGLAFLLATIGLYGPPGWQQFWRDLAANDVEVVPDWDTAYYGEFTRYGGDDSIVVSYASSPPAEVIFSDPPVDEAPTGVVTEGCYRQVEFAGILAGTDHPEAAGRLIDFMLSVEFQEQIPLTWFVFPANQDAELPPEFVEHTVLPPDPVTLDPAEIDANRERWIDEWTSIVLG